MEPAGSPQRSWLGNAAAWRGAAALTVTIAIFFLTPRSAHAAVKESPQDRLHCEILTRIDDCRLSKADLSRCRAAARVGKDRARFVALLARCERLLQADPAAALKTLAPLLLDNKQAAKWEREFEAGRKEALKEHREKVREAGNNQAGAASADNLTNPRNPLTRKRTLSHTKTPAAKTRDHFGGSKSRGSVKVNPDSGPDSGQEPPAFAAKLYAPFPPVKQWKIDEETAPAAIEAALAYVDLLIFSFLMQPVHGSDQSPSGGVDAAVFHWKSEPQ